MANLKYKDKNTNTWQSILLTRGATGPQGPAGKNAEISLNGEINQEIAIYAPVDAGTSGQVLVSKGENQAPQWENVSPGSGSSDVYTVDNLDAIETNPNEALSAHQGYVLNQNKVEKSTTIAGLPLTGNISISELNDSLKTISGDGSIAKIVELTYAEYKTLESNGELKEDTEYHISDWSESNNLRYTEEEVQEIVDKAVTNALNENARSAIMVTVGSNKTLNCETAWGTTVIPWDYVKYNIGDKFTLLDNGRVKYTGNKPVKLTIHLQYNTDDTCGTVYPIVSSSSYYQEYCSSDHIFATVIGIEQGAPDYEFYGAIRTSGTGKKYVYTGNSGASPYNYFMIEEL